ncbi:MAG: hypothetical protein ACLFMO_08135 [Eubacteriales bacterium]
MLTKQQQSTIEMLTIELQVAECKGEPLEEIEKKERKLLEYIKSII